MSSISESELFWCLHTEQRHGRWPKYSQVQEHGESRKGPEGTSRSSWQPPQKKQQQTNNQAILRNAYERAMTVADELQGGHPFVTDEKLNSNEKEIKNWTIRADPCEAIK